jgi:hypothetical protein
MGLLYQRNVSCHSIRKQNEKQDRETVSQMSSGRKNRVALTNIIAQYSLTIQVAHAVIYDPLHIMIAVINILIDMQK